MLRTGATRLIGAHLAAGKSVSPLRHESQTHEGSRNVTAKARAEECKRMLADVSLREPSERKQDLLDLPDNAVTPTGAAL